MRSAKRSLVWRVTQCVRIWGSLQKGLMIQPKHGWQWEISHMEAVRGSSLYESYLAACCIYVTDGSKDYMTTLQLIYVETRKRRVGLFTADGWVVNPQPMHLEPSFSCFSACISDD